MKKYVNQKAVYRSDTAKHNDNVICYAFSEVVLCR